MTAATDSARTDAAAQGRRTQSCSAVVLQDTKSTHSSALLASCRAQSSSAARVRKGAPSAQAVSLFAARSSQRKHSMRRKAFHLSPAQRKKIFNGWSEGPFQVEGGGGERVWEVCPNGPADHTCNASGHWAFLWECPHWSWHSACCCSVTAAGLLRPYPCTRLQLPSPCWPLLLPSPLRPLGTRARAYPRGDYMSLGSDSLGLQAWLCRLSCEARRIRHSEMVNHE